MARAFVISITIAMIAFMTAYELFFQKDKFISGTVKFTASVFCVYGLAYTIRAFEVGMVPSSHSYIDQGANLIGGFILSIIISNLWTFGLIIMVNQRLNMENQLEKEKLQLIFNTSIDAQLITRLNDGLIMDVNNAFSVLSGYAKREIIGSYIKENSFWKNPQNRQLFVKELNDKGICENMEFAFRRKDGSQFDGMISANIIIIHDIPHIVSVIRDITERKKFEEALIESEEKYRSILNASPDDITITDLEGGILMISPAAKKMFGYELEFDNCIGKKLLDFIIPEDVERAKFNIGKMYQGENQKPNEYRGVRQDKSIFYIEVNSGFVYDANGLPSKMVFIVRDITERKFIESQMQKLVKQLEIERNLAQLNSITDSLTGLANRRYLDEVLNTEFYRLKRSGSTLSLIMLDIDYFKNFNDSYGHLAGDECLRMIANELKKVVGRVSDIVARYGGEEFILILPETNENGAKVLGEKVMKGIEALAIPHSGSDVAKYVTVSIGIATVYPAELASPEQALQLVDEALYCAKERGRNRCVQTSNITA